MVLKRIAAGLIVAVGIQTSYTNAGSVTSASLMWEYVLPIPKNYRDRPGLGKLALSPDGNILAAAADNPTSVFLFDARTGELLDQLPFPKGNPNYISVKCVAYSPDERYLAASGSDGNIAVWDTSDKAIVANWHPKKGEPVWDIEFSPDGHRLAAVSHDAVTEWSTADWKLVHSSPEKVAGSDIAYSPNGDFIGVSSANTVLSTNDFQLLPIASRQYEKYLDFTPSGLIVTGFYPERLLTITDVNKRSEIISFGTLRSPDELQTGYQAFAVEAGDDDRTLAMACEKYARQPSSSLFVVRANRSLALPIMATKDAGLQEPRDFVGQRFLYPATQYARLLDDGWTLVTARWSERESLTLMFWDVATSAPSRTLTLPYKNVQSISVASDGNSIACSTNSGVKIFNAHHGDEVPNLDFPGGAFNVTLLDQGKLILIGQALYNLNGKRVAVGVGAGNSTPAFEQGRVIATNNYGSVDFWSLDTARKVKSVAFRKPRSGNTVPYLSADGKWLVCNIAKSDDNPQETVDIYDLHADKLTTSIPTDGAAIDRSVAISPDSKMMALAVAHSVGQTVSLFDIASGGLINKWVFSDLPICAVHFSSTSGSLLVTAKDGTTREVPCDFRTSALAWDAHSGRISDVKLSKDSNVIYSASNDGYLRAWRLSLPGTESVSP